jgi:hypothetical protein
VAEHVEHALRRIGLLWVSVTLLIALAAPERITSWRSVILLGSLGMLFFGLSLIMSALRARSKDRSAP